MTTRLPVATEEQAVAARNPSEYIRQIALEALGLRGIDDPTPAQLKKAIERARRREAKDIAAHPIPNLKLSDAQAADAMLGDVAGRAKRVGSQPKKQMIKLS